MISVVVVKEAELQLREIAAWWAVNRRAAPTLVLDEFDRCVELLKGAPDVGQRFTKTPIASVRRVVLRRTRHIMFYIHDAQHEVVYVIAVWGAGNAANSVVRARRFELMDEDGNARGLLTVNAAGASLALFDSTGKAGAMLGVDQQGSPGLNLFDEKGTSRAKLAVAANGTPGLAMVDDAQKVRVLLTVDGKGPGLGLYDAAGKPRATLAITAAGSPGLGLADAEGKLCAVFALDAKGKRLP